MTDDLPDPNAITARPGEEEARAMLKISRLLGDMDGPARERVLAYITARFGRQDDHK